MLDKRLSLNFVTININTNRVYVYKHCIALINKTINYNLNSKAHILNYDLEQYNRNTFVKIIDKNFLAFNKVLLIKFEFVNKYVNNILLELFTTIYYIF